ncbi:hematopoietic SH2 domain-containing protein homolog isoform X1 [Hemibagrus wyckioides]|uniref:hematopoietic SH2 domain-containing protein homolog isoform X1 n=1 Tax=Hemibagrus wyckioides TaxID=337641 RepID=UPI00266B809A|nr:hematopoietic SH2 domain-containing protein homolog isoform X1 [Hemibagrus wyckioides]XP_058256839.1 hematopoietic SH2 domain-containing protein homolog isoform X1 [Hemibagrus wyckioides]XP_058256840.1 hematopoietic SH2 domain-containing protein homolog isoform X1 [Hemibagrus wyckioides]
MAEVVTPNTVSWFTDYQKNHIVKDGVIPEWFHGTMSRKQAEEMLMTKPPGYFLIRVSESRIGYTLSYRADDYCRHFMIDMLPGNQCEIVGENLRHCSLQDLVDFHSRTPIHPYTELLTVACDQAGENISEDTPPTLAGRRRVSHPPIPNKNLSNLSDVSVRSPRLYPSLERELSALNLDGVSTLGILHDDIFQGSPLHPSPLLRTKFILTPQEITTRWHSANATTTAGGKQSTALPTAYNQGKSQDKVLQKKQSESKPTRIKLIQCKIFKKKKNNSEEHTYMEISEATTDPTLLQIAANTHQEKVDEDSGTLPVEYLNPPPFAPGY